MVNPMRLIVGLSGASGIMYGIRMLEVLHDLDIETDLVMTSMATKMVEIETNRSCEQVKGLATRCHNNNDFTSVLASGGYRSMGMVVLPCSMKTLAGIACGFADNLLLRAADCTLKERRTLVLVPRETPLNVIQLKNMLTLAESGVTILPAAPGFYHRPKNLDDLVDHIVGKTLDIFGVDHHLYRRWRQDF